MAGLQLTGLASGLDTNAIISQLMALERRPRARMDVDQARIQARRSALSDIESRLRDLGGAAAALRSPGLLSAAQTADSGDPSRVSVRVLSGAVTGGHQVQVTQLARAAQRTYDFTASAAGEVVSAGGHDTAIAAGATAAQAAATINSDPQATVWAAAINVAGTDRLVVSARQTGSMSLDVSLTGSMLTEHPELARAGLDARLSVDGIAQPDSHSNLITTALPGVELTLRGVTSADVTVNVGQPAINTDAVKQALQDFVAAYNKTVDAIRAKVDEKRVAAPKTTDDQLKGLLNGDSGLEGILDRMRDHLSGAVPGAPAGLTSLADLGISTGAPAGSAFSPDAVSGHLTIDDAKLTAALASNPSGVAALLGGVAGAGGFARGFEAVLDPSTRTGGVLDARIAGADADLGDLRRRMDDMDERLALRQDALTAQFAALERVLSQVQSQNNAVASQLSALTG